MATVNYRVWEIPATTEEIKNEELAAIKEIKKVEFTYDGGRIYVTINDVVLSLTGGCNDFEITVESGK